MGFTMRRRVFWPVLLVPLTVACTAILGDFTVGTGGGDAGDSGPDVLPPSDGGPDADGGPKDTGSDVVTPKLLHCAENSGARKKLNTTQKNWDQIAVANINLSHVRTLVSDGNAVHSFTIDGSNNVTEATTLPDGGQGAMQVIEIQRLQDRFIALVYEQDSSNNPIFGLFTIRDADGSFTHDFLTQPSPLPSDANRVEASVFAIDAVQGVYFLATFDDESNDTKAVLRAGYQKVAAPGALTIIDSTLKPTMYELKASSIVGDPQHANLILDSNGPGSAPDQLLYTIPLPSIQPVTPRSLKPPVNGENYFLLAFQNSPTQGLANLGVIEADLNTFTGAYHIGQVPLNQLATFNPSSLPSTVPPMTDAGTINIPDLVIDKANAHIESFPQPASESLIAVARTSQLTGPLVGFNFIWWDMPTGGLRAAQTGASALLTDVTDAYRAGMSFSSPPLGSLAQLNMAFEREPNSQQQNQPGDVFFTTVSCAP